MASSKLDPEQIATVVRGIAEACGNVDCALLGGETAEMPGVYQPGELDLVGTVVGIVARKSVIDGSRIEAGDVILGLPSNGLHTNGYTLARTVLSELDWHAPHPDLGDTPGNVLIAPHRCYLSEVQALWEAGIDVRGLAHITGGGLIDNPPRIFPDGLGAESSKEAGRCPPFSISFKRWAMSLMRIWPHAFNMGLGMLVIVPQAQAERAQAGAG